MKNSIFLVVCTFIMINGIYAQWSLGARFGGSTGVSLKKYPYSGDLQFEAISAANLDNNIDAFSETLLFEKFRSFTRSGNLGAFLGLGGTMIFGNDFLLGVSGTVGFDKRLGRLGFQVDWTPTYIFINDSYFSAVNAAFTIRWVFKGKRLINY